VDNNKGQKATFAIDTSGRAGFGFEEATDEGEYALKNSFLLDSAAPYAFPITIPDSRHSGDGYGPESRVRLANKTGGIDMRYTYTGYNTERDIRSPIRPPSGKRVFAYGREQRPS
jgi:hypothetical protein